MKHYSFKRSALAFIFLLAGLYACATTASLQKTHPFEVEGPPKCSECHEDERASLNHNTDFEVRHKFYATQQRQMCNLCHQPFFCSDCHANKEEIKPSDKYKDAPSRFLPHRGDYLTRHRVDGRINPTSCLKCHGRNNNARCKRCHNPK